MPLCAPRGQVFGENTLRVLASPASRGSIYKAWRPSNSLDPTPYFADGVTEAQSRALIFSGSVTKLVRLLHSFIYSFINSSVRLFECLLGSEAASHWTSRMTSRGSHCDADTPCHTAQHRKRTGPSSGAEMCGKGRGHVRRRHRRGVYTAGGRTRRADPGVQVPGPSGLCRS